MQNRTLHFRKTSLRIKLGGQFIVIMTVVLIGFGGYQYYDMRTRLTIISLYRQKSSASNWRSPWQGRQCG
jgi:seryl-tRNA synthetase